MTDILTRLRACRDSTAPVVFAPDCTSEVRMLIDAIEIADSCARADIECNCSWFENPQGVWWYDLDTADATAQSAVAQAVRYLGARGRIERDAKDNNFVRIREIS